MLKWEIPLNIILASSLDQFYEIELPIPLKFETVFLNFFSSRSLLVPINDTIAYESKIILPII